MNSAQVLRPPPFPIIAIQPSFVQVFKTLSVGDHLFGLGPCRQFRYF